ncbi:hypothetical protein PSPO01_15580 [Paraphaeosphaeria sporulosa]
MEARLAARRFYMARAPTTSHKSAPPSPSYRPPSIVSLLLAIPCLLIGRSDLPVRHFSPLGNHATAHCPHGSSIRPL